MSCISQSSSGVQFPSASQQLGSSSSSSILSRVPPRYAAAPLVTFGTDGPQYLLSPSRSWSATAVRALNLVTGEELAVSYLYEKLTQHRSTKDWTQRFQVLSVAGVSLPLPMRLDCWIQQQQGKPIGPRIRSYMKV